MLLKPYYLSKQMRYKCNFSLYIIQKPKVRSSTTIIYLNCGTIDRLRISNISLKYYQKCNIIVICYLINFGLSYY